MNILHQWVSNLSLRNKLLTLLFLPMLMLAVLSTNWLVQEYNNNQKLEDIALVNSVFVSIGDLLNSLQKERGMSAGFLASKGTKFVDALKKQRVVTDNKVALFNRLNTQMAHTHSAYAVFKPSLDAMTEQLHVLGTIRRPVDQLRLMPDQAVHKYSVLNAGLFDGLGALVRMNYQSKQIDLNPELSLSADLTLMQSSILTFLLQKEYAGKERALLTNVFSHGSFSRGQFQHLIALVTAQHAYNNLFMKTGEADYRNKMQAVMDSPQARQANDMRATAIRQWKTGDFGISAADWFTAISGKIEQLRNVEVMILKDLQSETAAAAQDARQQLTMLAIACAVTISLSILLAWVIITGMTRSFREAVRMSKAIAEGDLACATELVSGSDEAGQLMRALENMRNNLTHMLNDELEPVLQAARQGDLSQRLETESKHGFYRHLAEVTNALNEQMETAVNDTVAGLKALEHGDLDYRISRDYQGTFDTIKQASNRTAQKLSDMLNQELQPVWQDIQHGDLSGRIAEDGKQGFYLQLAQSSNELSAILARAIEDTTTGLQAIEQGDLTHRIANDYEGEFDAIKQAMHHTSEKLCGIISHVSDAVESVDAGAGEIAQGNNLLSSRTQEQAAALEETAASIEEITGTVQHTADNSRQANQLASGTREQAEKGGAITRQAIQAMSDISANSQKVADIIGVIDGIAFQTNLLALNAAVEAARAGEQGRGFAVVAGEVRSLAQRSSAASKEIKGLINSSIDAVQSGSSLVNESGMALDEIIASVSKVGDLIAEIDAASREQTSGIEQINQAIAQLDANTQQNTAMVEESAAVSQRLSDQAGELRQQVSVFHFDETVIQPAAAGDKKMKKKEKKRIKKIARKQVRAIVEGQSVSSSEAIDSSDTVLL